MKRRSNTSVYIVQAGIIAALYAALTYLIAPLSFGAQQLRISEALTVLPILTPAAVPGLTIGCLVSNLGSPYGAVDIICGTLATMLAGIFTRLTRDIKFKKMPLLSLIFPTLFNSLIVGAEITFFVPDGASFAGFAASALSIGIGETVICYTLGLTLYAIFNRTKIFTNGVK